MAILAPGVDPPTTTPGGDPMIRPCRSRILLALAALLSLAAAAWAEGIFTVNTTGAGPGPWVFDQPSVAPNGTGLHVAFVAPAPDPGLLRGGQRRGGFPGGGSRPSPAPPVVPIAHPQRPLHTCAPSAGRP